MKNYFLKCHIKPFINQIVILVCFFSVLGPANAELIIIANPSVPVDTLSKTEIMRIFLGKKIRWEDGQEITLAILKDCKTHEEFTTTFTEKDPQQFRSWWRRRIFTGTGMSPRTFDTEENLLEFVSKNSGSIGYISTGQTKHTVKIISIPDNEGDDL